MIYLILEQILLTLDALILILPFSEYCLKIRLKIFISAS